VHEANLQSIIIQPFQLTLVAFNQDWSWDFPLFPWYCLRLSAASHCLLILSSAFSVRDMCVCVYVLYLRLVSSYFCELRHFLNYTARIFGRANKWFTKIREQFQSHRKPLQLSRRVNSRGRIVQRDTICMRHTTRDRECECSKSVIGFRQRSCTDSFG